MRLSSQLSQAPSWFTTIAHREDATPVICFRAPPGTLSASRSLQKRRLIPPTWNIPQRLPATHTERGSLLRRPGHAVSRDTAPQPRAGGLSPRASPHGPSAKLPAPPSSATPVPRRTFLWLAPPFPPAPAFSSRVFHRSAPLFLSGVDTRAALWSPDSMEDVDLARYRSTLRDVAPCIPGVTCFRGLFGIALSSSS